MMEQRSTVDTVLSLSFSGRETGEAQCNSLTYKAHNRVQYDFCLQRYELGASCWAAGKQELLGNSKAHGTDIDQYEEQKSGSE